MSQTDVSDLAPAVAGIQIEGPGGPPLDRTSRVELAEETLTQVLPGEIDANVGRNPVPAQKVRVNEKGEAEVVAEPEDSADITVNLDDPDYPEKLAKDVKRVLTAKGDALFDPHVYDATPVLDGQATDTLQISLGGGVKLEAFDEDAQELFKSLRLGRFVVVQVEGYVSAKSGSYSENADGETTVVGKATIKGTGVRLLRPEDLA
jgi:hypothetical protein